MRLQQLPRMADFALWVTDRRCHSNIFSRRVRTLEASAACFAVPSGDCNIVDIDHGWERIEGAACKMGDLE